MEPFIGHTFLTEAAPFRDTRLRSVSAGRRRAFMGWRNVEGEGELKRLSISGGPVRQEGMRPR